MLRALLLLPAFLTLLVAGGPAAAQETTRVAIIPFAVSGALEFEGIGPFVPGMLASRMHGMGPFRFIDTVALIGEEKNAGLGVLSADEAAAYARRFQVGFVISGAVRRSGGTTIVNAQVYAEDGSPAGNRVVVPVSNRDDLLPKMLPLAEELADRLRTAEKSGPAPGPATDAPDAPGPGPETPAG
ncbi:MAG: hypothetical protein ACE5FC_02180 [Myxococcota bacterium]